MFNFEKIKEKKLYDILTVICWVLGAWMLWEFVYELSHMIGAIVCRDAAYAIYELLRMLPMTLCMVAILFFNMFLLNAYIAKDIKARAGNWKLISVFAMIFGIAVIIYVIAGLISGRYISIVECFPTLLYPLDTILLAIFFIIGSIWAYKYSGYLLPKDSSGSLATDAPAASDAPAAFDAPAASDAPAATTALPFAVCRFNPVFRNIGRFFCFLSFLVSICAFAATCYGPFILDWCHGYILFNIVFWLIYFSAFFMYFCYRFIYCKKSNEEKPAFLKKYSLIFLLANIILMVLYIVIVNNNVEAPAQNAFGLLPIDFTASANVFHLIYGANNILVPLFAFLYSLKASVSKKA